MTRDVSGYNGFGLIPTNLKTGALIAQNVAQTLITLPDDGANYIVVFSIQPGSNVFIDNTTTASVFSGTTSEVTSELNPTARQYKGGTAVSAITPDSQGAYVQALAYVCTPYIN